MIRLTRHARGIVAAVTVLALAAGTALGRSADPAAGTMPDAAQHGLDRAAEVSGMTVPAAPAAGEDRDEDVAPDSEAPDEGTDAGPNAGTDAPAANAPVHPDNHGAAVSAAARITTPDSFANHGAYVRSVAKANHGQTVSAGKRQDVSKKAPPAH